MSMTKHHGVKLLFWIPLLLTVSCKESDEVFTKNLIQTLKSSSIEKNNIDWNDFEAEVMESLKVSKDSAIIKALTLHNNPHTTYIRNGVTLTGRFDKEPIDTICSIAKPLDLRKFEALGYLKVRRFYGHMYDEAERKAESSNYITEILNAIQDQDRPGLKGWIIDLRYNYGGDMWPMLIALSPFFVDGELGSFRSETINHKWSLADNIVYLDNQNQNKRVFDKANSYKVKHGLNKVAVLINNNTASSGEAVAIALNTLKNVRFFGKTTHGFTSANTPISMGSGEMLVLTTSIMYDNKGRKYPEGINPNFRSCNLQELEQSIERWINKD